MHTWVFLVLSGIVWSSDVIHTRTNLQRPPFLLGRPPGGHKKTLYHHMMGRIQKKDTDYSNVEIKWFKQKLDHFNPLNERTWNQKYFHNKEFSKNNSLIFLMIGGEGPESAKWSGDRNVTYLQWAAKYGAEVFDVEHRFFGDSFPIDNMAFESMKLCTTEQALADLANFIIGMNKLYGYNNPRWITFGGSYPGSLSAFFRAKYPDLTVGAVASSAPVNLKLDFFEYGMVVEDTVTLTDTLCPASIQNAFEKIRKLTLSEDGRTQLNNYFQLNPPFDEKTTKLDVTNFFANVYSLFQGMIQYTYDGRSPIYQTDLTARVLCDIMTNQTVADPIVRVVNVWLWYLKFYPQQDGSTEFPNDYWKMISALNNDISKMDENGADRGWMWLCCNEIGFLQTTNQGRNMFGAIVPLNYFIDMCTDLFDPSVTANYIRDRNVGAQNYYKMASEATNIVLPNGSLDPWHALGTYTANASTNFNPILINGTAHCSDMYPAYKGEPAALAEARLKIEEHLVEFMNRKESKVTTTPNPASTESESTTKLPAITTITTTSGVSTNTAEIPSSTVSIPISTSLPPTTVTKSTSRTFSFVPLLFVFGYLIKV